MNKTFLIEIEKEWWRKFVFSPLCHQIEMAERMGWTFKKEYVHSHSSDSGEVYSVYHTWVDGKNETVYSEWVGEVIY